MKILLTAVDTGYYSHFAYQFVDTYPAQCIGVKGRQANDDKFIKIGTDAKNFKPAKERPRLYILEVESIKDELAERMGLVWQNKELPQPAGFMNFPEPSRGLYTINSYFIQYEAEEKVIETNDAGDPVGWKWVRKHSGAANHYFDVMVYNLAVRDIVADIFCREANKKYGNWADVVELIKGVIGKR